MPRKAQPPPEADSDDTTGPDTDSEGQQSPAPALHPDSAYSATKRTQKPRKAKQAPNGQQAATNQPAQIATSDTPTPESADNGAGDVPFAPLSGDLPSAEPRARAEGKLEATNRLKREGRWAEAGVFMDRFRDEHRGNLPRGELKAAAWAAMVDAFPPLPAPAAAVPHADLPAPDQEPSLSGLSSIPIGWPTPLPANSSLSAEVAWASANRLAVLVRPGVVDLSRALAPAPSWAALSWLETALLYPAKFADIAVRASSTAEDERETVRRERLAIAEVRALLAEMLE